MDVDDKKLSTEENNATAAPEEDANEGVPTDAERMRPESEEARAAQAEEAPVAEAQLGAPVATGEPAVPEAAPPKTEGPKRTWYVVHCYSGYENKVKKGLEQRIIPMGMQDLIFRAVVPTEEEIDVREGQRKVIQRRVFPGYILVEMAMTEESWYVVRNTPGVTGFVSSGDKPTPLREDEVAKILKRMETEQPKVRVTYRQGQVVHIIDGPFADFRGTVDEVNMEKGKVRVMISFFGRDTPVELDLLQVEKV